jgi:hypothetical protein
MNISFENKVALVTAAVSEAKACYSQGILLGPPPKSLLRPMHHPERHVPQGLFRLRFTAIRASRIVPSA